MKNPPITGVLATDAQSLINAYGSQAAGWAKDFAFACRNMTDKKYWMKVYKKIISMPRRNPKRNPRIYVLSDFFKSKNLANLLAKKDKKEYIVVNAHAVTKYPMLDSEELDTFEVMTPSDYKKIDRRKRGYIAYSTKQ